MRRQLEGHGNGIAPARKIENKQSKRVPKVQSKELKATIEELCDPIPCRNPFLSFWAANFYSGVFRQEDCYVDGIQPFTISNVAFSVSKSDKSGTLDPFHPLLKKCRV